MTPTAPARRALLLLCALGPLLAPAAAQARRHRRARPSSGRPEDDAHLKGDAKAFAQARVRFAAPAERVELAVGEPVRVELNVTGYALGAAPGAAESAPAPHAHLVVDNDVALLLTGTGPVLLRGLAPGPHALRVVLCRPWHEVVKAEGAFALARFWVGPRLAGKAGLAAEYAVWPDPRKPILTYVLPLGDAPPGAPSLAAAEPPTPTAPAPGDAGAPPTPGTNAAGAGAGGAAAADAGTASSTDAGAADARDAGTGGLQAPAVGSPPSPPPALDFFLSGAKLVRRGHKVRVVIDKKEYPTVRAWKPLRLEHLRAGQHRISIDLLDRRGTKVRNALNRSDRTFTLPVP